MIKKAEQESPLDSPVAKAWRHGQLLGDEDKKQTGRLKLKLKMEEGKVVKVDDSQLLPDEPEKRNIDRRYSSEKREKSKDKSENGSSDSRKNKKNKNKLCENIAC